MNHVFLTGERGVGKSTALKKALKLLLADAGGLETAFDGPRGAAQRTLSLRAWGDAAPGCPAARTAGGRLQADRLAFDAVGAALLRRAHTLYSLIVIDELGALEAGAGAFQRQVMHLLDGEKPLLGVARWGDIPWLQKVKAHPQVRLIQVTPENRERVPFEVVELLRPRLKPVAHTPWQYDRAVRYELDPMALYDENRRPIGLYQRGGGSQGYLLHVSVWVRDSQGGYLLLKRHPHSRMNPGLYENPGGHALFGESGPQAAVRELMEEAGIPARPEELTLTGTCREGRYFCDSYLLNRDAPLSALVLQPDEAVSALWARADEVEQMMKDGRAAVSDLPF